MKDSVIIVSGGMDSVTMLHEYRDRIALHRCEETDIEPGKNRQS